VEFNIVEKLLGMTLLGSEWVLWLLLASSVLSVAVIFERYFYLNKLSIDVSSFTRQLSDFLNAKDFEGAVRLCEKSPALESQVALVGLKNRGRGPEAMEGSMDGFLIGERQKLDKYLVVLGTLGNNAPFIGLFGTVLGIIKAFSDLSLNTSGGPSVVMAGISEALVATAVGLLVAIPAVIFYNFFNRIVKKHVNSSMAISKLVMTYKSQLGE
jgi:biopolymer transport protein ExbB